MDDPHTLDYATPPRRPRWARAQKWLKRLALAILLLACLWAAPLAWLYVGWKREEPAREGKGTIDRVELAGPAWLERFIPAM